ncbi:hypothetical protein NDU88_003754 [Pleurodeles waltl]|uniref:Uncharacterized protein n=1 Tax=Pleurodeles waltl TaxID=8319 RepID=A0AAV7LHZ1_PLEWA|nr:hypothetical protein NDU88_003754 [Pleurodeles waltl]
MRASGVPTQVGNEQKELLVTAPFIGCPEEGRHTADHTLKHMERAATHAHARKRRHHVAQGFEMAEKNRSHNKSMISPRRWPLPTQDLDGQ